MNVGIIGLGIVGTAVMSGLQQIGHTVYYYDVKIANTKLEDVLKTEIVFVCVPTEALPDGRCDSSIVKLVIDELISYNYQGVIAIKSTVIPGTTEKFISKYHNTKICFVPEFLRQKSALTDFMDFHDVLVVGTVDDAVFEIVKESHGSIPQSITKISPTEAEIVKYFNNVHNAMEIVFANNVYEISSKLNANYQNVYNTIIKRKNINPSYLRCSHEYRGFSGACLPKDTEAWAMLVKDLNIDIKLFDAIVNDNKRYL